MKALFTLLSIVIIPFTIKAQDLTGTWEGSQQLNGKTYNYNLYLSKSNNTLYTGVVFLKEAAIQKGNGQWTLGVSKPSITIAILGSFNNNLIKYSGLSIIETKGNVGNLSVPLTSLNYSPNGKEQLTAADNSQLTLTKKDNKFPSEYAKYTSPQIVSLSDINYVNGNGQNKIAFSDKGLLSLAFANNSSFDIPALNINIRIQERNSGVKGAGNIGSISLLKQQTAKRAINLTSGFDIPTDSIHLIVQGTYNGLSLFSQTLALATTPFYLTNTTKISATSAQTLNALQGYYGFNKAPYAPVAASLTQLASTGNKLAPMWQGIFQTMGYGGFSPDESAGLQFAKKSYSDVVTAARNGDAEAQYLMFYAIVMGLTGEPSRDAAGAFLKKAADGGFLPAMYDWALYLQKDHKYGESYAALLKCYDLGMQKAALNIGFFSQEGFSVKQDAKKAIEWYQKGETFGDPAAMLHIAYIYSNGEGIEPNAVNAIAYATKAANLKNTAAMVLIGNIYLNGRSGVPKNVVKAIASFKDAANLGDTDGMTILAYLNMYGTVSELPKDEKAAYYWAKKSAEAGGAKCMALLANMYHEGTAIEKNVIKYRFWANQAYLNGAGEKDNTAEKANSKEQSDTWNGMDLSDRVTVYTNTYTGQTWSQNNGPDYIGEAIKSGLGRWQENRMNQQAVINGLEFIYDAAGKKIYGGTLTSKLTSEIYLKKGQTIKVSAYGTVKLGDSLFGLGGDLMGSPDGVAGYQNYCVDPSIPHGAIMVGMNNKWTFIGKENTYTAVNDGPLQIAINDADYTNNKGYFDVVIKVDAN